MRRRPPSYAGRMRFPIRRTAVTALALSAALVADAAVSEGAAPQRLRDTGLYVDGSSRQVRPENLSFAPQYPLWSDGATKRRWLYIPPGKSIDAARPDAWEFPTGTK